MRTYMVLVLALATAAGGADMVSAGPACDPSDTVSPRPDDNYSTELYWDNGAYFNDFAWNTGIGTWAANDFDVTPWIWFYNARIYYPPNWPNNTWEGNIQTIFRFSGGTPGSMISGTSRWVRGSGSIGGWQNFPLAWVIGSNDNILIAFSQVYDYPNCDPVYPLDTNTSGGAHSWYYYAGAWSRISNAGYGNRALMIRITVNNDIGAVAPSSFGRVKAMYH